MLGWAGSVYDHEATAFAAHLYERLGEGESLVPSVAEARLDLLLPDPEAPDPRPAAHWHLARRYLGPTGGGVLATGDRGHRRSGRGFAQKAFLDKKGEIPVAGELEFVGRRRETQSILREFAKPLASRPPGVLIHGLGRQGKSSLAARVASRLEASNYRTVVVFERYDAAAILSAIRTDAGGDAVSANQFTLPDAADDRTDLAALLYQQPLPPLRERESRKQAAAKLAAIAREGKFDPAAAVARLDAIIAASRGNPGRQDRLFRLARDPS